MKSGAPESVRRILFEKYIYPIVIYTLLYVTHMIYSPRKRGGHMPKNLSIKVARVQKDMTQKDLAAAVGVSRQTINAIEQGEYNPTIKLCRAICRVLGKTLDELFWEDDCDEKE